MTRRYKPTRVGISHSDTRFAEFKRESSRPRPEPAPVVPTEPSPAPTPPSRPTTIVVEKVIRKPPRGGALLTADEVADVQFALMRREAHSTGAERDAAISARRSVERAAINARSKLRLP